jgi:UDP-glucuronate decarboxylase
MVSKETGPINIGNPQNVDMLFLAKKIKDFTNSKSKIIYKELPKDDPQNRIPDISLAKEKLNWKPEVSLYDGLYKTIKYFEDKLKMT